MKKIYLPLLSLICIPAVTYAQTFQSIVHTFGEMLTALIPIMLSLALLAFFWGLTKFIWHSGSPETRKQGMSIMVSGIGALFVMVSIWGIVALIQNSFGIDGAVRPNTPEGCPIGGCGGLVPKQKL